MPRASKCYSGGLGEKFSAAGEVGERNVALSIGQLKNATRKDVRSALGLIL
jgi:hypothetical protein